MEQQQQRQESLERRTSTTGMYQTPVNKAAVVSPFVSSLAVVGFFVVLCRSYAGARLLKITESQNGGGWKGRLEAI